MRCGKLNVTYHGKLRLPQYTSWNVVHDILFYPSCTAARVLRRPTFKFIAAAVHEIEPAAAAAACRRG